MLTLAEPANERETVKVSYTPHTARPIQRTDGTGDPAESFKHRAVTNNTETPAFLSASVDGRVLTLTFDQALDEESEPAPGSFAVTASGDPRTVTDVDVSGSTVVLTLAPGVGGNDTVAVSYTKGATPIRRADGTGSPAVSFENEAVTNVTETPAPQSASVDGTVLTLDYGEALDEDFGPAAGDFTVTATGNALTVSEVDVSGSAVVLTLASAVGEGETVTVSYAADAARPIQRADGTGSPAESFTDHAVTNVTGETPVLESAVVHGTTLTLLYDEPLDQVSRPAATDFAVSVAGSDRDVTGVTMTHSAVVLTLADPAVTAGQRVTVSYTKGANPIQDTHANRYEAADLDGVAVDNRTSDTRLPRLVSATVQGNVLTLTYDEALDPSHTPPNGAFYVLVAFDRVHVTAVEVAGRMMLLTLAKAVNDGQDVRMSYNSSGTDGEDRIQDFAGNWALPFGQGHDGLREVTHGPPPSTGSSTPQPPTGGGGAPSNGAPVASAGADAAADPGASVTLDGSASTDPDGDTLNYAWTLVSGASVTLSGANTARATFTAPAEPGDLVFRLTVTDPGGLSASDEVTVTVGDGAPSFGDASVAALTLAPGEAMEAVVLPEATGGNGDLDYSLSSDPAGLAGLEFDPATRTLSGTPGAAGSLTFTYTAHDADANRADADAAVLTFAVTVRDLPVAVAGADAAVGPGASVTLDGSGSTDPDGDTLSYAWTLVSGASVTLAGADTARATFTAPAEPGDLVFRLTVTDPGGLAASHEVTVTVRDLAPGFGGASVAAMEPGLGEAMDAVALPEATGGNGALTYSLTSDPAGLAGLEFDPATRTLSGTPAAAGSLTFTYTVHDADANRAATDAAVLTFAVTVRDLPVAVAGADAAVGPGASVTLDGSGSTDPDGDTLSYAWTLVSGASVTLAGADTARATFTAPAEPGDLVFRLTVTDPGGLAASHEVTVTVRDLAPGFGDVSVAALEAGLGEAMDAVALPEATGGNGAISTYSLTSDPAGLAGLEFDPATRTLSGTPAAAGSLTFTYTAHDADANRAATDAAVLTFAVTVRDLPVAVAGADAAVGPGASVTLDGSGSTDPDGDTLSYAWTLVSGASVMLAGADTARATFTAPAEPGDLVFRLTVTDPGGLAASHEVTVTVRDLAPGFGDVSVAALEAGLGEAMDAVALPEATGGNGALTYSLTSDPAGLAGLEFDPATRTLSGTPAAAGSLTFTYTAHDADANRADTDAAVLTFAVTVRDLAPSFGGASVAALELGLDEAMDAVVLPEATGGNGDLDYSLTSDPGGLAGLVFDPATRALSGTPAAAGSLTFTYTAHDADANRADTDAAVLTFAVTVRDLAPSFGAAQVAALELGLDEAMDAVVLPEATGGNGALTYSLTSAPAGLAGLVFDPATRTLSGTPAAAGSLTFTYTAHDADANRADTDAAVLTFAVTVRDLAPSFGAAQVAALELGLDEAMDAVVLPEATGGNGDLDYSLASDPAGLAGLVFDPATRTLSGTPAAAGSLTFTYTAHDADANRADTDAAVLTFAVTVRDLAPSFGAAQVAALELGLDEAMDAVVLPEATGGNGALTYSLTSAPAGLAGLAFDPATRTLSGTPTAAGSLTFTYTAHDADANRADTDAAVLTFAVTVRDLAPSFGAAQVAALELGLDEAMDAVVLPEATGGNGDLDYSLTSDPGGLAGLVFDPATRTLSGTPAAAGSLTFTYTVHDADANRAATDAAVLTFRVTVEDLAPSFGGASVAALELGLDEAMDAVVLPEATGGNGALTYSLTSAPAGLAGLAFDPATRTLSGTPVTAGSLTFTYTAHDADANRADTDAAVLTFAVTVEDLRVARVKSSVQRTLAAVARRALSSALDNIGARFAATAPASALTLAGETVPLGLSGADPATGLSGAERSCAPGGNGFGQAGFEADREGCASVARSRTVEASELLHTSAFSLTLGAAEGSGMSSAPLWAVWGRGDLGTFAGRPEGMRYEGELRTGWLGVDARSGPWVAGLAVSHGVGETDYSIGGAAGSGEGRLETELTALYPYGRWTVSDGLELRVVLGAGQGEAVHRFEDGPRETSDLSMWMGSVGLRHELPALAGIDLAARADASLAQMETDDGPDYVDNLTADSWRLRAGLEASRRIALDDDTALTPFVEAAARRDGGDGLEGTGLEVAGGLRYEAPGLHLEARGRWLAAHSEEGAEERGLSVTARMGPGARGRGLSLMLSPRWGAGTGGADALWRDELPKLGVASGGEAAAVDAQIGYGVGIARYGLLTPFAETGLSGGDSSRLRLGTRFEASHADLGVELAGERRQGGAAGTEHLLRLDLGLRF